MWAPQYFGSSLFVLEFMLYTHKSLRLKFMAPPNFTQKYSLLCNLLYRMIIPILHPQTLCDNWVILPNNAGDTTLF